ncbi:MAG: LptF/LptG family permease [Deltaproteobacteria bacterium]|nr:LptF/LptG family permease [Deltaproteobacteria bacterium]MCX7953385.1 LptF/LptG family permease [Deltaproteobacteria bacterium]
MKFVTYPTYKTLTKFLIFEHVTLTLLFLGSIVAALLLIKLTQISITIPLEGLSFIELMQLTIITLPSLLDLSVPIALTLSGCALGHRLSIEKNLTAIRSLGYSLRTLFYIVSLSSLIFIAVHAVILNWLRPISNSALQAKLIEVVENNVEKLLKPGQTVDFGKAKIMVGENKEGELKNVLIFTKETNGINFISAKRGSLNIDHSQEDAVFQLQDGISTLLKENEEVETTEFTKSIVKIPLNIKIVREFKRSVELSNSELSSLYRTVLEHFETYKTGVSRENLSHILQIKFVTPETMRNKLISLRKEISRRYFGPLFDAAFALFGFLMGMHVTPKPPQYYFPLTYFVSVFMVSLTIFLCDFCAEHILMRSVPISEGYFVIFIIFTILVLKSVFLIASEKVENGLRAFLRFA